MMEQTMEMHKQQEQKAAQPDLAPPDARTYLRQVRRSYLRSHVLCERAERYRHMAMRATGRADALRVSGTGERSKLETYVLKLMDVHNELKQEVDSLLKESRCAEKLIRSLPDERYHAVLQFRYLCGMSWEEIADKLHFTQRWVHKLHNEALRQLDDRCLPF